MLKRRFKQLILIFLSIFAILFLVQFIDQAINGKTYAKINAYFAELNKINRNNKCLSNVELVNNIMLKDNKNGKYPILSDKFYDSTIDSCHALIVSRSSVAIPQDIPEKKQVLLKKLNSYNNKITAKYNINYIIQAKKCEGYKSCLLYSGEILGQDPFEIGILMMKVLNTDLKINRKASVKYILVGFIGEYYTGKKIKEFEKEQKDFLSKKHN